MNISIPVINGIGMQFVPIPEGQFFMKSDEDDSQWNRQQYPPHPVHISGYRAVMTCPMTRGQWCHLMTEKESCDENNKKIQSLPITNITWYEAMMCCHTLSNLPSEKSNHRTYRLPTEAEWEYMCLAGGDGPYSYGITETNLKEYAWYKGSWLADMGKREYKRLVAIAGFSVGKLLSNRWGVFDMHGNVYEWLLDSYDPYVYRTINGKHVEDPVCISSQSTMDIHANLRAVVRGGNWLSIAEECQCHFRLPGGRSKTGRYKDVGFRVVLEEELAKPLHNLISTPFSTDLHLR